MSQILWLIAEDRKGAEITAKILKLKYPSLHIQVRFAKGISDLADKLDGFIKLILSQRNPQDCIAVLHDADEFTLPHERHDHDAIAKICQKYADDVIALIAHDEIEAWLLADSGICQWLKQKPANYDEYKQPSKILAGWLDKAKKGRYREVDLPNILRHVDGTADLHSKSLQHSLRLLADADCMSTDD